MSDKALLEILASFQEADVAIDRWIADDKEFDDLKFLELQQEWENVCYQAAAVAAVTTSGLASKARILVAVLKVVAPSEADRQLHEQLAESLARDVLALWRAEKLH